VATADDNINYSGPNLKWNPPPGQGRYPLRDPALDGSGNYSNLDLLKRNLNVLIEQSTALRNESEKDLKDFNLSIDAESELENAQISEWPDSLGDHKNYMTYSQYRTMKARNSTGSSYLQKEYENEIRGSWGSVSLDTAEVASDVLSEATRIKRFIENYISGESNDQSQQRAIELFQDWTNAAIESTGQFRYLIETKNEAQTRYSKSELDKLSPDQARQYQTILQVQLNAAADDSSKIQKDLEVHLGSNSELFYDSYLGPALQFRRDISSRVDKPESSSLLSQDMYSASRVLDDNVKSLIKDMMRRNDIYTNKVGKLFTRVSEVDMRRKSIQDLAVKGSMPINPFIQHKEVSEETDHFEIEYEGWIDEIYEQATPSYSNEAYAATVVNRFLPSHNLLTERFDPDSHPQYLLKDGGTITGNITVVDGVTIDGVDISGHTHSGSDGSANISGSSIAPGTLASSAVDVDDTPDEIEDLRLVGYNTTSTLNGDTVYEATIAWEGPDGVQFEIQMTRLT
jgi:hypothetical protein